MRRGCRIAAGSAAALAAATLVIVPAAPAAARSWAQGDPLVLKVATAAGTVHYLDVHGINLGRVDRVLVAGKPATELHRLSSHEIRFRAPDDTYGRVWLNVYVDGTPAPRVTIDHHAYVAQPTVTSVPVLTPSTGGEAIVHGTNLAGATSVWVGKVRATALNATYSQTQLTVRFPAHSPGHWHVRVVSPYAESPANTPDKTYYTAPRTMSWQQNAQFDVFRGRIQAVSCPTDTFCAAVDPASYATYNGHTWSTPKLLDSRDFLTALACSGPAFCLAGDAVGGIRQFDGSTWTDAAAVLPERISAISCATAAFCVALDGAGDTAAFDGSGWGTPVDIGVGGSDISCPTTQFCAAIGNAAGVYVRNQSGAWSFEAVAGAGFPRSVDCVSASFCVLLDEMGNAFVERDGTWSAATEVFTDLNATAVACSSPTSCIATNFDGMASEWDGTAWTTEHRLDGINNSLGTATCSATRCLVGDQQGRVFVHDADGWSGPEPVVTATAYVDDVSCPAANFCMTADTDGTARTWNGSSWSVPTAVDPGDGLIVRAVDCTSATFCVLVGPNGGVAMWDGSTWTLQDPLWPPVDPDDYRGYEATELFSLSCASPTFCMALTFDDTHYARWDGTSWTTGDTGTFDYHPDLSCASSTMCLSTTQGWDGTAWRTEPLRPTVTGIDCPSAGFCLGHTNLGYATMAAGSWQYVREPVGTIGTCVSDTWCEVLDPGYLNGAPRSWDGSTWSDAGSLPTKLYSVRSVSCWAPNQCVAVASNRSYLGTPR